VLRLSAPAAAVAAAGAIATAPVAPARSAPDLALSVHDLNGKRLPPAALNPLAVTDGPGAGGRLRRRHNYSGAIIVSLLILILVGSLVAFFIFYKRPEPIAATPPNPPGPVVVSKVSAPQKNSAPQKVSPQESQKPVPVVDQARVNEAIRKGVEYLKKEVLNTARLYHRDTLHKVAPANAHLGAVALAGLTLLECGVPPDDPAVQRAARDIRASAGQIHATYTLATAILFLDRLHADVPKGDAAPVREGANTVKAPKKSADDDRALIRSFALRIMTCQDEEGFWGYGRPVTKDEEERTFQLANNGQAAAEKLWYKNLSNSQFAALALWAAKRHGVPVRPALQKVAQAARAQQTAEGTWSYDLNLPMKHTSACAGLIFLALERALQPEAPVRAGLGSDDGKIGRGILDDPAVKKAMEFLGKFLNKPSTLTAKQRADREQNAREIKVYEEKFEKTKGENVPSVNWAGRDSFGGTIFGADSWGDLYLLWSIERVGVIYDVKEIQPGKGGKDWYNWGADIIVANQKEGGLWEDRFPGVPDTCFALLFLKRANIAKDLTDKLRELLSLEAANAPPRPMPGRKE
jgi:hypothetical protein